MPKRTPAPTGRATAVYVRVSTAKQDTAAQEADLKRFAATLDAPAVWFRDKASGSSMNRPAWNRLAADCRAGKIERIVVWRIDRLGRTAAGLAALFEELPKLGVGLVSLRDGIDLATPAGRLMSHVIGSVAQYENEVRAERIVAGQQAARAAGKVWGGSAKGRRITVTDEQVRAVHRMKAEGATVAAIARATGMSRPTAYRLLAERQ